MVDLRTRSKNVVKTLLELLSQWLRGFFCAYVSVCECVRERECVRVCARLCVCICVGLPTGHRIHVSRCVDTDNEGVLGFKVEAGSLCFTK